MKVIDKEALLDTFQYFDKHIVVEIIDIFIREHAERIEKIRHAVATKDFQKLKFESHSLKGVIANFVAEEPKKIAYELEEKGGANDPTNLEPLFEQLQTSVAALVEDLNEIRAEFIE